jgi:carbamoyl-phosphate synthase large subunit
MGARAGVTTILVTACGAPGAARLLRALKENGEREVRLVGADMSERAIGRHLCDAFHLVPPGADPTFPDALLALVEQEGVDVVLPESSHDLRHLAPRRGEFPVPVMICGPDAERRSNDKAETFEALHRIGVGAPDFRRVTGAGGVEDAARELGYPDRPVCFKPVFSSGSRGFRVLDPSVDRTHQLLNERPGALAMRLEEAVELLPEDGLDLLVMEFLTEPERTVDGIADGSRIVLQATRTRESVRCGLGMYFVTLDTPDLVAASERVVAEFGLEWFFSIQFMGQKVIEINPRISTMMIQEDFNLPWLAVKRALGEASDDELRALQARVRPGHTVLRFFDQVEFDP